MEVRGLTLSCQEVVELVTEYLENEMPEEQRARFEQHLTLCSGCQRYLEQMRRTIELTGTLLEEDVPEPAMDALRDAFRALKKRGTLGDR